MKYEHGQNCWNGPDRSAVVTLQSCSSLSCLITLTITTKFYITPPTNKKAELTLGLACDRAATWRLTVNLASLTAILTCAATWRKH